MSRPRNEQEDPETISEVTHEREAIEEMVRSDGWRIFTGYALREWQGRGYVVRMKAALSKSDPAGPHVIDRAADEIVRLLRWPENRVEELKGVSE